MRHQRTLIWLALLAGPVLLRAQPPAFSLERRSCPAADSALGTLYEAQSRGRISRFHSSGDDRTYIRTGGTDVSGSGILITVSWAGDGPPANMSAEILVTVPTPLFERERGSRNMLSLSVDGWLHLPFGVPTPPTILAKHRGPRTPISAVLQLEDLMSVAKATSAVVVYSGKKFAFEVA